MGGIKTPIEIESNLSWNRLARESFQAIPVPESWNAQWRFQIPPVSYPANGFVYLVGVGSDSAPPTWRLGCSVRLASGAVPDSTGEFSSAAGLPLRIDDRRPCTLGSYTLLTWPDMNLTDPHLIVEFPHWLQDATIEIFWYDGETTGDFFSKLRESLVEIFGDTAYLDENLGQYIAAKTRETIQGHEASEDPHIRYLQKYEAAQQYLRIADLDVAVADSDALRIALDAYLLKSEAAAFVPVETFNQERLFVDAAIEEAKAIAATDLADHLAAENPHGITPEAIGIVTQQEIDAALTSHLATIDPHPQYLTQERGDIFYAPKVATEQAIASHLAADNPHAITPGAIGAATVSHIHLYSDIADRTGRRKYTNPILENGWTFYIAVGRPADYHWDFRELAGTLVSVNGLVKRDATNSITDNNIIFSFNHMYAPPSRRLFITWGRINNQDMPCRIDVTADGKIIFASPLTTSAIIWLSLDSLIWFNNQ